MISKERIEMIAPCGIDCSLCELFLSKDNPQLYEFLISKGIPKDRIPCTGCRKVEGNCPVITGICSTYECVTGKKVEFCYECSEFPCVKLHPSADRADILPHNLKVFNLCTIKFQGIDRFVQDSAGIKNLYYKGKMAVGKGPSV